MGEGKWGHGVTGPRTANLTTVMYLFFHIATLTAFVSRGGEMVTMMYYTTLHYTTLHYTTLHYTML